MAIERERGKSGGRFDVAKHVWPYGIHRYELLYRSGKGIDGHAADEPRLFRTASCHDPLAAPLT